MKMYMTHNGKKQTYEEGRTYIDHLGATVTITRFVDDPKLKPIAAKPEGKNYEQFYHFNQLTEV